MSNLKSYVKLSPNVYPKKLENYYLLDKGKDELYELNEEAFDFVCKLDGTRKLEELIYPKNFIKSLIKHELINFSEMPEKRNFIVKTPFLPSLRYLEIQLTNRCNLNCLHCYQGEKDNSELPLEDVKKVLEDFIELQGLRLILSGGEPLLYSHFTELNKVLKDYPARVVLLTNGTLLKDFDVKTLNVDEIQFSLDGMEHGHNYIRGKNSFSKLIDGVEKIKNETNIDVSFATMIHKENLNEFRQMKKLVKSYGAKEWGIDIPLVYGNLKNNIDVFVNADKAINAMKYRFGASFHSTEDYKDYACGVHLMTLTAKGEFLQCSFFPENILATTKEGFLEAVKRRKFLKQEELVECRECEIFSSCHGGCRYRAGSSDKRDFVMCRIFGKE